MQCDVEKWTVGYKPIRSTAPTRNNLKGGILVGKIKVYRVSNGGGGTALIVKSLAEIPSVLSEDEIEYGEKITISAEEMDKTDFDNLPEWDGFNNLA